MIRFSIIIPCYNSEEYIRNCLEGLKKISFTKDAFEVLFVDDCSKDKTVQTIFDNFSKSGLNFKIINNRENSGPGYCRRVGAESAGGEYLCFCDSDDWLESDILINLDNEIANSGSDVVIFDMSYVMGDRKVKQNITALFHYGDKSSYLSNCAESLCTMVVKRNLFLSVPTINIRNGEDLALVPLIIEKADIITHINKSFYNYYLRESSVSLRKPDADAYKNMITAFNHIKANLKSDNQEIINSVELLGIKTILYNATFMAIKGGNNSIILSDIINDFNNAYPLWYRNVNIQKLGLHKKVYLWFVRHKLWGICKLYIFLHSFFLTR